MGAVCALSTLSRAGTTTSPWSASPGLSGTITIDNEATETYIIDIVVNTQAHASNGNETWELDCLQTQEYISGQLVNVPNGSRAIASFSAGWGNQVFDSNAFTSWANVVASKDATWQTGVYVWKLIGRNFGATISTTTWTQVITKWNPTGGQSSPPAPGGAQSPDPGVQTGFWQNLFRSLFVPQQESIDLVKAEAAKFATWGPFGLYNVLNGSLNDVLSTNPNWSYLESGTKILPLPFGYSSGGARPYVLIDLAPYWDYIKWTRIVFAGCLWWTFLYSMWNRIYSKA